MTSTDTSEWPRLEQPDTSNATFIDWKNTDNRENYSPDMTWDDDRYPRRYGDYYQNLDEYNNGYKNQKYRNKPYYTWLENDRLMSAISCQFELTQRERACAKGLYHQLPLQRFGTYKEDVAIALCLYVIEKDDQDNRRGHPNILKKWQFKLIYKVMKLSEKEVFSIYGKIENRIAQGDLRKARLFDNYRGTDTFSPDSDPIEYEYVQGGKAINR